MEKGEEKVAHEKKITDEKSGEEKKKFNVKDIKKEHLILLFLVGIFLVYVTVFDSSTKKKETSQVDKSKVNTSTIHTASTQESEEEEYITNYENKLKKLLEKMEGVGKAEVMLTLNNSEEQVVLKDMPNTQESLNETDTEGGSRISSSSQHEEETVMITTKEGESVPYITKEIVPKVEGVVVLAQGGGDGEIATKIVNAVCVLFDVPAHKVQVLQMSP